MPPVPPPCPSFAGPVSNVLLQPPFPSVVAVRVTDPLRPPGDVYVSSTCAPANAGDSVPRTVALVSLATSIGQEIVICVAVLPSGGTPSTGIVIGRAPSPS